MAGTGTATFLAPVSGFLSGDKVVKASWPITAGVAQVLLLTLASGDNTVNVPAGTTLIVIAPPLTNTFALRLKGGAGDTGVGISATQPTILAFSTSGFLLNAAGIVPGVEINFL